MRCLLEESMNENVLEKSTVRISCYKLYNHHFAADVHFVAMANIVTGTCVSYVTIQW